MPSKTKTSGPPRPPKTPIWLLTGFLSVVTLVVAGFVLRQVIVDSDKIVSEHQVTLSAEFRSDEGQITATPDLVNQAIAQQKSFVVFVSYPICSNETARFKEFVREFQEKNHLSFYYLTTDNVKDTPIADTVHYFPTVVIFDQGEIANYLRFDSDVDTPYYKTLEGFSKWFYSNVVKE